jgi:hypothetical protein
MGKQRHGHQLGMQARSAALSDCTRAAELCAGWLGHHAGLHAIMSWHSGCTLSVSRLQLLVPAIPSCYNCCRSPSSVARGFRHTPALQFICCCMLQTTEPLNLLHQVEEEVQSADNRWADSVTAAKGVSWAEAQHSCR